MRNSSLNQLTSICKYSTGIGKLGRVFLDEFIHCAESARVCWENNCGIILRFWGLSAPDNPFSAVFRFNNVNSYPSLLFLLLIRLSKINNNLSNISLVKKEKKNSFHNFFPLLLKILISSRYMIKVTTRDFITFTRGSRVFNWNRNSAAVQRTRNFAYNWEDWNWKRAGYNIESAISNWSLGSHSTCVQVSFLMRYTLLQSVTNIFAKTLALRKEKEWKIRQRESLSFCSG